MTDKLFYKNKELVVLTALLLLFLFFTRYLNLAESLVLWLTDMSWTLLCAAVAWKSWQVSKKVDVEIKATWRFISYAHLSWLAGILVWDYLELIQKITTPFPALSDFGFMLFSPLMMYALVRSRKESENLPFAVIQLSKLGIFATSIVCIHIIVLSPVLKASSESVVYIGFSLAYPVLYIAAFLYSLMNLWLCEYTQQRFVLALVVASTGLHALVVSIYSYSLLGQTYATGAYIDVLWLVAFALMYLATVKQEKLIRLTDSEIELTERKNKRRLTDILIVPVSMLLLLVVGLAFSENIDGSNSGIITGTLSVLILFYISKEIATHSYEERLTQKLKESEQRFRDISVSVPGVIYQFCLNSEGGRSFAFVSPRIYDMLGIKAENIMQDAEVWFSRIHPDDIQSLEASILESWQNMSIWNWTGRIVTADGRTGWCEGVSVPRKINNETVWNGIVLDITEKKEAELTLINSYDVMECMVQERTKELVAAKELAEESAETKSKFLAHMSHEFRTPLNAIIGFSQLLQMGNVTALQSEYVEEISSAGDHLLALVNDLLDLEKIEAGKMLIKLEPVNVGDLFADVDALMMPAAAVKNITIINECKDEDIFVLADKVRLRQVLLNLMSNAIKYNLENGAITVGCEIDGDYRRIKVTDTGIGVKQESFEKLFEPFDRLGAEAGITNGTGIGLAISKRLAEMMDGTIGVESESGRGSTFWVRLPDSKDAG